MNKESTLPASIAADESSRSNEFTTQARQSKIPHELLDQLIEEIENPQVGEMLSATFTVLLNLLQDVPLLATTSAHGDADDPDVVVTRFRREAKLLIDHIETVAISTLSLNEQLAETLDGVAFALSHDLKRTLDLELKDLGWKSEDDFARGKIAYVRGLLTNCLQQSIITLAQVFDPDLDGGKLFDNYQARLRESLLLCRDITDMVLHAHACEKDAENFPKLVDSVNCFRGEAMQFLMYKDWQEFEAISDKLLQTVSESSEVSSQVHSFICYLETLLGQVKLRSVLVDVFCDLLPEGEGQGSDWSEAQHRLAFELYRAELTSTIDRNPV